MKLHIDDYHYIDFAEPKDISLSLTDKENNPRAWYVEKPNFETVINENFVGSINLGGSVNFRNLFFNPHAHGTHTECLGHITQEVYSVNQHLKKFFFHCLVLSVTPEVLMNEKYGHEDRVITRQCFQNLALSKPIEALAIRTLPNHEDKKHKNYSNTNPAYLDSSCYDLFDEMGIQHLLIDLPSIDREDDGGELAGHHRFWNVPTDPQFHKTITELIFINNNIADGEYLLELQMAPIENDASPSRPVLYEIKKSVIHNG